MVYNGNSNDNNVVDINIKDLILLLLFTPETHVVACILDHLTDSVHKTMTIKYHFNRFYYLDVPKIAC